MGSEEKRNKKVSTSAKSKTVKKSTESKQKKPVATKKVVVKKKVSVDANVAKKDTQSQPKKRVVLKVADDALYATGRRKESTAKVWLFKGNGNVKINRMDALDYLSSERLVTKVMLPLSLFSLTKKYDVRIDVVGGGLTGQAGAAVLGLSRAVLSINEDFRSVLREHGLLTQDRREKERKKYGKRGARKSPQFRKR